LCHFRDKIKLEFVQDAYRHEKPAAAATTNGYHAPAKPFEIELDEDLEGACALPLPKPKESPKSDVDVMLLETTKILELFPNYGTGYIRRLLAFYENNSEIVISKILEGKKVQLHSSLHF